MNGNRAGIANVRAVPGFRRAITSECCRSAPRVEHHGASARRRCASKGRA
jgi:hypothetical protein